MERRSELKAPIRVAITGVTGHIGYNLCFLLVTGSTFGTDQPLILQLLGGPTSQKKLQYLKMELQDGAYPLLEDIIETTDPEIVFKEADVAVMMASSPRLPDKPRDHLLMANKKILEDHAKILEKQAKKNVKVLVVTNPTNTSALICMKSAPSIPKENFMAMVRLDTKRGTFLLSEKLGVHCRDIQNVVMWGNHSCTLVPDISHAVVKDQKALDLIKDQAWIVEEFVPRVRSRGNDVRNVMDKTSCGSAAQAITDTLKDWWVGTKEGEWASMAVHSAGNPYGIDEDLFYAFPCICQDGKWKIVPGLERSDLQKEMMKASEKELQDERTMVFNKIS